MAYQIYLQCKFTKSSAHTHIYIWTGVVCWFFFNVLKIFEQMLNQNNICTRNDPSYAIPGQSHWIYREAAFW